MVSRARRHRLLLGAFLAAMVWARLDGLAGEAPGEFRFVVYGGSSGEAAVHRRLVEHMARARPDLVLHTGEVVPDPREADDWRAFDAITEPLRQCPFYVSGARDEQGRDFHRRFPPPRGASGNRAHYAFEHKGAQFIVLDAHVATARNDPQTRWLAAELAAAQGRPVFVLLHSPLYSIRARGRHRLGHLYWQPLFARYGVTAVFGGSHHFYFRTTQGGVPHIVTAAGGAMFHRIDSRRALLPDDVVAAFYHFVEVTVSPKAIRCRVVDDEGRTRDEFGLPLPREPQPASG